MTYIFLADGFEEIEALTVVDILRRAEIEIEMVSINDGLNVTGSHGIKVIADRLFSEIEGKPCDMLILPGGPGVYKLIEYTPLLDLLKQFYDEQKLISAICAAPIILGKLGFLNGRDAVCYPAHEDKLIGANIKTEKVVQDGFIITSKGPSTAMLFALKIVETLKDITVSEKLKQDLLLL